MKTDRQALQGAWESKPSQAILTVLAFFLLSFSLPAVADYTVSLLSNQKFATLAAAESAMRAFSTEASHLTLDHQDNNAQIYYGEFTLQPHHG